MDINRVILKGRIGTPPQCRETAADQAVCSFVVATSETWADKNGKPQERTTWHKVIAWGKLAGWCREALTKGSEIFLEGKLIKRTWQDKEGQQRSETEIQVSTIDLLRRAA